MNILGLCQMSDPYFVGNIKGMKRIKASSFHSSLMTLNFLNVSNRMTISSQWQMSIFGHTSSLESPKVPQEYHPPISTTDLYFLNMKGM